MSLLFNILRQPGERLSPAAGVAIPSVTTRAGIPWLLRWLGFTLLAVLLVGGVWLFARRYNVEPYVPVLGLAAIALVTVLTRKFTGVLVAGLLYVGNFKTTAAVGVSVTDPTFIVLTLCAAGLLLECLFIFSRPGQGSLLALFEGQGRGVLLFIFFLAMIGMSVFYTAAPESGLQKLERIAVFCSIAFFAPFIIFKKPKDLDQFLITTVVLSLLLSLRNLVDLFHPTSLLLSGNQDITRIGDGELIGTTLVTLVYHRFSGKRAGLRLSCIALLSIGLIASAARSAALSVLIVLVLTSFLLRSRGKGGSSQRIILVIVLVAIVGGLATFWIRQLPAAQAKFAHKFDELDDLMHGSFLPGGTAEQRMNFYKQSLVAIAKKPILGWGVAGWGAFFLGADQKAIPHNFVLEAAVEEGLIGCALLLAILFTAGWHLRRIVLRAGPYFLFLLPVFLLTILLNLVTGDLESRLLWLWCGTIMAVSRMVQQQLRQQPYSISLRY